MNMLLTKWTTMLKTFTYAISKRRFLKQVGILLSGTVLAQGLIAVSSPIITRLYLPEALGIVAVFTSIINLASSLASLAYPQAVPLPKTDREAVRILQLSWLLLTAAGIAIVLVLLALTLLMPNSAWTGAMATSPPPSSS